MAPSTAAALAELHAVLASLDAAALETVTERHLLADVTQRLGGAPLSAALTAALRDELAAHLARLGSQSSPVDAAAFRVRPAVAEPAELPDEEDDDFEVEESEEEEETKPAKKRAAPAGVKQPAKRATPAIPAVPAEPAAPASDLAQRVLAALAAAPPEGLTVAEVARSLKAPKSDCNKALYAAEKSGSVRREAEGTGAPRWFPGAGVATAAPLTLPAPAVAPAAAPAAAPARPAPTAAPAASVAGDVCICDLGGNKRLTVSKYRGATLVGIREYYERAPGDWQPGFRGLALQADSFRAAVAKAGEVAAAVAALQ